MTVFLAKPDNGPALPTGHPAAARSWIDAVSAQVTAVTHSTWLIYGVCGVLAGLLTMSLYGRNRRTKNTDKAELTGTDRAVTRITGILATAVVALGAWKVFGDVLHLHWFFRMVLFFFAEAQIVAAWRRVRRHIHRHATLGPGIRTIYGIALGSALVAAMDADRMVEVVLRFFAALVAAYMISEELAEELDIHLQAHPALAGTAKKVRGRIKWALTPERILVWLRLAEPSERTVEEVERQRRIARFARTAYRLHLLRENNAKKWRINLAQWSLRRQTEAANEHLRLATDQALLSDMRAQLALLYQVEDTTTRAAVADLNPLRPTHPDTQPGSQTVRTRTRSSETRSETERTQPPTQTANQAAKPSENPAEGTVEKPAEKATANSGANPKTVAAKPSHPLADHPVDSVRKLARAFARNRALTNADLGRKAGVSTGTANRYMPDVRAAFNAAENQTTRPERTQQVRIPVPIPQPSQPVLAGVNGYHQTPEENLR
ncbi:hypothetical protein ACWT_5835 [Actinoplanes sp. SE50]|nr:hypothetical protein ACPL_5966 [Actinoplanes sp. SE50/110]ATO85250.1 hypothetical protein ACWT_5835 [Actinoplanes sp. SE50]SLM02660.1 hypothetical protein ACSP50_5942 [Actinoplanes sp. SE50/110]